ncbi:MAG: response regulator [bacterium]
MTQGSLPVVFCRLGKEEESAPGVAGQVMVLKQDRQEILNQVNRLLFGGTSVPVAQEEKTARTSRHILIIEDSPTLRGILRRSLEKAFPLDVVREAVDGRQALSEMSQKKVDLIITDLEMPDMDGITFLNHLQKTPLLARKPVLIFSGNINESLMAQAASLPNVRFLSKPADPEKVVGEVNLLLGR